MIDFVTKPFFIRFVLSSLFSLLLVTSLSAQIEGQEAPAINYTYLYTCDNCNTPPNVGHPINRLFWEANGGTIMASTSTTVTVKWTTLGPGSIYRKWEAQASWGPFTGTIASKGVSVGSAPPSNSTQIDGPPTSLLNETLTYSCPGCYDGWSPSQSPYWSAQGGTIISSTGKQSVTVKWTTQGTGRLRWGIDDCGGQGYYCEFNSKSVTVGNRPPTPNTPLVTYNYCDNANLTFNGTPPTGTMWYWQTSPTGLSEQNSASTWNVTTQQTYFLRAKNQFGWSTSSASRPTDPNAWKYPPPPPITTNAERCGEGSVTLNTNSVSDGWFTDITGGTKLHTGSTYQVSLTNSVPTKTYYVEAVSAQGCRSKTRTPVTAFINSSFGGVILGGGEFYSAISGSISLSEHNGNIVKWQYSYNGINWIDDNRTFNPLPYNTTSTIYYRAEVKLGTCPSVFSQNTKITIFPKPKVTLEVGGPVLAPGGQLKLIVNNSYYGYLWFKDGTEISGATSNFYNATQPGSYSIKVRGSATAPYFTSEELVIYPPISDQIINSVTAVTYLKEGKSSTVGLELDEFSQQTDYLNGLGGLVQKVMYGASPTGKDMVQPVDYDNQGRVVEEYLPYVSNGTTGAYRNMALNSQNGNYIGSEQFQFYQGQTLISSTTKPFSKRLFEDSPFNKVVEQGAPGEDWQPNLQSPEDGHTIKNSEQLNLATEQIKRWGISSTGLPILSGFYANSQLVKQVITDERGIQTIEYITKEGNAILKRHQSDLNGSEWADTYYIYDNYHNLRCVLPPMANSEMPSNNLPSDVFLEKWAFCYKYDANRRMTEKRVPGSKWVYMVYDNRDRLVLTQDGVQRPKKEWSFTKYDTLNRSIVTGIYTHGSIIDQGAMSGLISTTKFAETYTGNTSHHGYSNMIFPTANLNVLTVNYYDNYTFKSLIGGTSYNYKNNEINGQKSVENFLIKGLITGNKTKVLEAGTTQYLWNATYYDDKYRPIQSVTQNLQGGTERVTNIYNFPGWLMQSKLSHTGNDATSVLREYFYDHAGRLEKIFHTAGVGERTLISKKEYNELGELVKNNLHSEDNGTSFMQGVDFRYNIRGWLTNINNSDLSGGDAGDLGDYFGMELGYNNSLGTGNSPQFNGNISGVKWSAYLGSEVEEKERAYNYSYDPLNRIESADYKKRGVVENILIWNPSANEYKVDNIEYDLNGNIQSLRRKGANATNMDVLTYKYGAGSTKSNQLLKVSDTGNDEGFKDGSNTSNDYLYDPNGNMYQDLNKGITNIAYNHLNLPEVITKSDGTIKYIYDATGTKLAQEVIPSSGPAKRTDYIGELIFENDELQFIQHEEGRIMVVDHEGTGILPEYQYHIKDHLGNVRTTFTSRPKSKEVLATVENGNASTEALDFDNYDDAVILQNALANHTPGGNKAIRLNATNMQVIGLAKSFKVYPGDKVKMEVYAKYIKELAGANQTNVDLVIAPAFLNAFGLVNSGETQEAYQFFNGFFAPGAYFSSPYDDGVPNAYLNFLLFDKDYNLMDAGFDPITIKSKQPVNGTNVAHDTLDLVADVTKEGYIYIYLSNENDMVNEVFFDDFKIEHIESPVIQADDYYPFGLTFNMQRRENATKNQYLYNDGTERITDLELGIDWTPYRVYDPAIARWWQQDLIYKYHETSYAWVTNNPIRFNDPSGLDTLPEVTITAKRIPSNSNQGFVTTGPLLKNYPKSKIPRKIIPPWLTGPTIVAGTLTAILVTIPTSTGANDVFFKMLSDEEETRYYELLSKKSFGEGLTPAELQELQELEELKYPYGNPFEDEFEGSFEKMPQGDNTKKNQEVHSLYTEYGITDPNDQRRIHDLITGKGLSRKEIRDVIKGYLNDK